MKRAEIIVLRNCFYFSQNFSIQFNIYETLKPKNREAANKKKSRLFARRSYILFRMHNPIKRNHSASLREKTKISKARREHKSSLCAAPGNSRARTRRFFVSKAGNVWSVIFALARAKSYTDRNYSSVARAILCWEKVFVGKRGNFINCSHTTASLGTEERIGREV